MSLTVWYYNTNYETVVPENTLGAYQSGLGLVGASEVGMDPGGYELASTVSWRRAPWRGNWAWPTPSGWSSTMAPPPGRRSFTCTCTSSPAGRCTGHRAEPAARRCNRAARDGSRKPDLRGQACSPHAPRRKSPWGAGRRPKCGEMVSKAVQPLPGFHFVASGLQVLVSGFSQRSASAVRS